MPNRREFLTAVVATSISNAALGVGRAASSLTKLPSLVPLKRCQAPNYWCTWALQNYMFGQNQSSIDTALLEGDSGNHLAHEAMNERALLGREGWASTFHSKVRGDLYLLLDDGWEAGGTATFELDSVKFPSFKGSATERLRALNNQIKRLGWRGAALWCRNTPGGAADSRLVTSCSNAGIGYWKIDVGDPNFNVIRIRDSARIPLTLEHVHGEPPVNGNWRSDGRFGPQAWDSRRPQILRHTDVYRTYDVTSILSLPTTLDRVSELMRTAAGHTELHSLLNVEDEVYVAAVLGCTMGVMRHPLHGLRPASDPDLFFNGPRKPKLRMDEVVRALRWQRIAAPFPCGVGTFQSDGELRDGWTFAPGETWEHDLLGTTVWQGAPAVMARNVDLPTVTPGGDKPFVFAARFPNGAVAVGTQERTSPGRAWYMPSCQVTLNVKDAPGPFGVFGEYERLTLTFMMPQRSKRILAQDLAGDNAIDITHHVEFDGASVHFSGGLLREVGLRNSTAGDLSSPGLVIALV